jgi:radical SAM protein with 4Fe4S-binding SPASM domain
MINKTFCVLPWINLHSHPGGNVYPCSIWRHDSPVGNINSQTIDDIANSSDMNLIRQDMIEGKLITGCHQCNVRSESRLSTDPRTTHRSYYNLQYKNLIPDIISNTNSDGSLKTKFSMKMMNLRFSNLCNYSCRHCIPAFSSLWGQELKHDKPVIKITDTNPNYLNDILERLPEVEYINFTGGESILTDEHWIVLDELIRLGKTDIKIDFWTNLSKLEYKGKNLIEYVKKFNKNKFQIRVSIDDNHERAEHFRNGTNWNTLENNLRTLINNDLTVFIQCVANATNVWHLTDLHRYLIDNNLVNDTKWQLTNLVYPEIMSSRILPVEFKNEINEKIKSHCEWLNSKKYSIMQWIKVMDYMNSQDQSHLLDQYIEFNNDLDRKRNQNILVAYPELKKIWK